MTAQLGAPEKPFRLEEATIEELHAAIKSGQTTCVALAVFQAYHNFVLPHASLRQLWWGPEPTNGSGSAKQWQPCTPAMAVGLTDHMWSLKEVLLYRVPLWPQLRAL